MSQDIYKVTTVDSMRQASRFVRSLGDISSAFTACVRSLVQGAHERTEDSPFSFVVKSQLQRLSKSPTLMAHVYYAALSYYPERFVEGKKYTPMEIVAFFNPEELGTILATLFYQRKMVALLGDEWKALGERMQLYCDVAVPLGQLIPSIGSQRALMVGAGRYLGWGTIAINDPAGFKKYRINLKVNGKLHDMKQELANWGTTHCHIATHLFQSFGIGKDSSADYMSGLLKREGEELTDNEAKFRVAETWLNSINEKGGSPQGDLGDDFEVAGNQAESFERRVLSIIESGSPHNWLAKTRSELTQDKSIYLEVDYDMLVRVSTKTVMGQSVPDYLSEEEASPSQS